MRTLQKQSGRLCNRTESGDNVHAFRDAGDALGTLILKYSSKEEMFSVIENMDQFVHIIID